MLVDREVHEGHFDAKVFGYKILQTSRHLERALQSPARHDEYKVCVAFLRLRARASQ
jgi:hypothetical protein